MGRSIEPSTLEVGKFFRKFTQVIMGLWTEINYSHVVEEKSSKNLKFNGPEYLTATFGLI